MMRYRQSSFELSYRPRFSVQMLACLVAAVFLSFGCMAHSVRQPQKKMVFVLDASGSMIDQLPIAVNELKRVIEDLKQHHSFTVVCYSGRGVYELHGLEPELAWGPQPATATFKAKADYWLTPSNHRYKVGGSGRRYAATALRAALNYEPEVVVWLSDGLGGEGPGAARHEVAAEYLIPIADQRRAESGRGVRINMIQVGGRAPDPDSGLLSPMQKIAQSTGGAFKYVHLPYEQYR